MDLVKTQRGAAVGMGADEALAGVYPSCAERRVGAAQGAGPMEGEAVAANDRAGEERGEGQGSWQKRNQQQALVVVWAGLWSRKAID